MVVVGITGKATAGKDTFAEFLKEKVDNAVPGNAARIHHFADSLKEIARHLGWDGKKDERGRRLLQLLGTEVGRGYNPNIWTDKVIEKINHDKMDAGFFIVADTRFPNEVEIIKNFPGMDGIIVHIERPALDTTGNEYTHSSETALDGNEPDIVIQNDGTLEDFRNKANELVELISKGGVLSAKNF